MAIVFCGRKVGKGGVWREKAGLGGKNENFWDDFGEHYSIKFFGPLPARYYYLEGGPTCPQSVLNIVATVKANPVGAGEAMSIDNSVRQWVVGNKEFGADIFCGYRGEFEASRDSKSQVAYQFSGSTFVPGQGSLPFR